jgi:hypothetical protein
VSAESNTARVPETSERAFGVLEALKHQEAAKLDPWSAWLTPASLSVLARDYLALLERVRELEAERGP